MKGRVESRFEGVRGQVSGYLREERTRQEKARARQWDCASVCEGQQGSYCRGLCQAMIDRRAHRDNRAISCKTFYCKHFGFHSEGNWQPLESSEQRT